MHAITMKASEFKALVTPVLPLAGNDLMLPVLTGILIETKGGYVTATATDRFRAGVKRLTPAQDVEAPQSVEDGFKALIGASDIKRLLAWFKPSRGNDPELALTLSEDGLQMTVEQTGTFAGWVGGITDMKVTVGLISGKFPNVVSIIVAQLQDSTPAPDRLSTIGVNAHYIGDFKHAVSRGAALQLRLGKPKVESTSTWGAPANPPPILVMGEEDFIGLLMPRKITTDVTFDDAEHVKSWTDLLAPEPAEKPKRKSRAKKVAS
jgi:hypothetical protein